MKESIRCLELVLEQPDPFVEEWIETLIWELDPGGFERQDEETFSELVEEPRPKPAGAVRWRVHRSADERGEDWPQRYREALDASPQAQAVTAACWLLEEEDWQERWKEFFRPAQVSDRVVVHPPWEVPPEREGIHRLCMEPGMAFGTGTHETTRLCVRAIDRALLGAEAPVAMLDVGTGSGILAIAARLLGAGPVLGIDNDADAVRIARENAEANGVEVALETTALEEVEDRWPLVVANILPHVLIAMRPELVRVLDPAGLLVLSGILLREEERVREAFETMDLRLTFREEDGEWCALHYRRKEGAP